MLQFVLDGAQGSFPVPTGESRIGSDAACQICIRGEGILPVHAYLRTDGEKLLIRPADSGTGSGSHEGAQIKINGQPLTGPANIAGGQELALGGVQMRLRVQRPGLWTRAWFRRSLYAIGTVAALLLVAWLVLDFWYLDEARLKTVLSKEIFEKYLHRDCDPEFSIVTHFFKGEIDIKQLKIKDRYNSSTATPFLSISTLHVKLNPWLLLPIDYKDCSGLRIELDNPEINIERSLDGTLNIKDIIQDVADRLAKSEASDLGLTKLDFTIVIKGGSIHLNDNSAIGETRLQNIDMILRQPGAGEPLEIISCNAFEDATPKLPKTGKLSLSGHVKLIDPFCNIDLTKLSTSDLQLDAVDFDLARIFEHFGYAWEPYNTDFKVVLGKPLTGTAKLSAENIKSLNLKGEVNSESLISIKEPNRPAIGNIPTKSKFDIQLTDSGKGYSPEHIEFELRSGAKLDDASGTFLDFTAAGGSSSSTNSNYTVNINCTLQDLLNTDVGRRLGLERYLGGHLSCTATLVNESGTQKLDVRASSEDSYVMVDTAKAGERPNFIRQQLPLNFSCRASALPGDSGRIAQADIESFSIKAPPSLIAESVVPGKLLGLDTPGKLAAQAKFKLKLDGRKFWQHFAKILALLGFTRPIEEILDLDVTIVGEDDIVKIGAIGSAIRQWHSDPEPVRLETIIDYDVGARAKNTNAEITPYLKLQLGVSSQEGKALDVHLKAQCSRSDKTDTVRLEFYDVDKEQPEFADVAALRERFNPYIESYLHNYDTLAKNRDTGGVVEFYRDTVFTGSLKPTGSIAIQHITDPKSKERDRVNFDLKIASKNFKIDLPFKTPPIPPATIGGERWAWSEENAALVLKGTYMQRLSDNKEEPDYQRLQLDALDVEGSLGAFHVGARDLDLFKLANLRNFQNQNQTWTDVLAGLSMSGQIDPPAYDFLRSLGIIPADIPVSGTLALQIEYDRQKDALDLQKFKFKQAKEKTAFFLSSLDVTGALLHLRELSSKLLPVAEGAPPFTERFSALLDEGGPAALLDHLGENLTIDTVRIETSPLREWLCRDYAVPVPGHTPPAPIAAMIRGDWRPEGTWSAGALRLERDGDAKDRKWKLLGAKLRNDFTVFGQPSKTGEPRPTAAAFTHDWSLALGLALHNNTVAISGDLILDDAYMFASLPALKYEFTKPAKQACTIQIGDLQYSHLPFPLAQIGSLNLIGKPFPIELKNFDGSYKAAQGVSLALGSLALKGGPLPCGAVVRKFEPASDQLDASLHMEKLDLPYLSKILNLPDAFSAEGTLNDVDAHYKGSLVALRHTFMPGAPAEPDIKPNDPRLSGLNPETDSLEVDSLLENVRLSARAGNDRGATVALGGNLHLSTRDLSWKDFSAAIDYRNPGAATVKQTISIPRLAVNSLDAKQNLARAIRAQGMPIALNLPITSAAPVNFNALFGARQCFLTALGTTLPEIEELKVNAFDLLAISGSLKAPQITLGTTTYADVDIPPEFSFKALKLSQPLSSVALFGDKLALNDAEWDLSKAKLAFEHGNLSISGVEHRQTIKLTDGDLAQVVHSLNDRGFKVSGRVGAEGNLSGTDFENEKRLTWNGGVKFAISNLLIKMPPRPQQAANSERYPLWIETFAPYGEKFCTAINFASGHDSSIAQDLNLEVPLQGPLKQFNGLLVGLQAYLSKSFGVELETLEFEPIKPTVVIRQGIAEVEPFQLTGTGDSIGLDLHVDTVKINLTDETFAGEVVIYPTSLPPSARERLMMAKWPAGVFPQYVNDVINGKIKLRCSGSIAAPTIKYPWAEVRVWGRRALFGMEKIEDLDALDRGRKHLQRWWGILPTEVDSAAVFADRMGVGLPGTMTARTQGETIVERVTGLPQQIQKLLPIVGDPISPRESLKILLNPIPDPPPPKAPPPEKKQ